jgi:predicted Zn-dependent protease
MRKLSILLFALLPATSIAKPEDTPPQQTRPQPPDKTHTVELPGPPSRAVTNEIVDAVAEEMNRDMQQLVLPGMPRPYSISYKITEVDVNDVAASLGETTSKRNRHFVNLEVRVRVGSKTLDNGNFVVADAAELDGTGTAQFPLEPTARIAKRAAWNATDAAYKKALIQLEHKLEALHTGAIQQRDIPAWTDEKAIISDEPVLVPPLESLDELEARAKRLSSVFRDQHDLRDSHVAVTSYLERRWYLTTEGTSITDTRRASGIVMAGEGQAEDGQIVHNYFLRYGHTAKDLPNDDELKAEAKRLAESVSALAKAPVFDRYSGPVLFEGEGAVGLIRATLSPHLDGTPVPDGLNPQDAKQFGGALTEKVGLKVIAPILSIVDDPTARDSAAGHSPAGKALIGGYKIDDEGVPAQRVDVVKDGVLKTLLTSRTPSARGQSSNGHARRYLEGGGGAFHGMATNLFLLGRGGAPRKALEQRLVAMARDEGLKYGLVIRRFDDAAVTGAPESTRRELVQMVRTTDQQLPPPALLAYRVYPNGKEELVRGVQLAEVPIRAWKDVAAVSSEVIAYNFLSATESQLQLRISSGTEDGFVPSGGFESAIVTPDLLVKDLDVISSRAGRRPLPVVAKP